jgi:glucokinase
VSVVWGLDIGGTKCAFVRGDVSGRILSRREVATGAFIGWETLLSELLLVGGEKVPLAVGISCGGPLNSSRGLILSPPNLPGWDNVPMTDWISRRVGAPASLRNEANACALAEWRFGVGRGCRSMVFLTLGTGFGTGLILDGRLYEGTLGMAGEIGHVRAAEDGPLGYGKRGSYEGFCSGGGIAQLAGISAKEAVLRAEAGDAAAISALRRSADMLGAAVAVLIDLFAPERIVIGSIFARAEKWFRGPMEQVTEREALPMSRAACRILPAALGDALGDTAALSSALDGLKEGNYGY